MNNLEVKTDDPKKDAKGMLFVAWCYSSIALWLGLYAILTEVFASGFNFFTIPALAFIFHYFYTVYYMFATGDDKPHVLTDGKFKFHKLLTFMSFGFISLTIFVLCIQFWSEETKTEEISNMLAVFLVAAGPWAVLSGALLNCLRMERLNSPKSEAIIGSSQDVFPSMVYVTKEQYQQLQHQMNTEKLMV